MSIRIFRVDELERELKEDLRSALLELVVGHTIGEVNMRFHNFQTIGGPANGPDTVRITLDVDVPLVQWKS